MCHCQHVIYNIMVNAGGRPINAGNSTMTDVQRFSFNYRNGVGAANQMKPSYKNTAEGEEVSSSSASVTSCY